MTIVRSRGRLGGAARKLRLVQSGLIFHFDAGDLSGSDGDAITTLPDRTALQTFTQGTATKRGVLKTGVAKGGKKALRFDSTDDVYTSAAAASAWKFLHDGTGCVIHLAVKPTSGTPTGAQEFFSTGGWSSTNTGISIYRIGSSSNLIVSVCKGVAGQSPIAYTGVAASPINTAIVITLAFSSARGAIWLDDTNVSDAAPSFTPSSSNPSFTAAVGLTSVAYPGGRDLYEIAIYNQTLSDSQIAANIAYLKTRWV